MITYQYLVHHDPQNDSPAICARCGTPIIWEYVVDQDGELISYGSECVKIVLGQQFDEEEAQRRYRRQQQRNERIRRTVQPTTHERKSDKISKLMTAYFDALLAHDDDTKQQIAKELEDAGYKA